MDLLILLLLWFSFASFVTLHVALAFTIGQRRGMLRAWLCLLVLPLMPYFGFSVAAKTRSVLWGLILLTYLVLLYFATR